MVIEKVTVTVTPNDVYKFYDGTVTFNPEFTTDAGELLGDSWIVVKYGNSASADAGKYTLSVSAEIDREIHGYEYYKESINLVLSEESVTAFVLPANNVVIENKNYPTLFTYGDEIPVPVKEYFSVNFDVPLSFEWYTGEYDYYEDKATRFSKISGQPKNAGVYVLHVKAEPTENTLGAAFDLVVEIEQKEVGLSIIVPDGTPVFEYDGYSYYLIDSLDQIRYEITGLAGGDTIATSDIQVDYSLWDMGAIKNYPDRKNYLVTYYLRCYDEFRLDGNYRDSSASVYVSLASGNIPVPQPEQYIHQDDTLEYELLISWKAPGLVQSDDYYEYTVRVLDSNGDDAIAPQRIGRRDWLEYNNASAELTESGEYTVVITCSLKNYLQQTIIEEYELERYNFSVTITNEYGVECDRMSDLGKYTVSVIKGTEKASAEILVQRRITMLVKETFINLNDAEIVFNKENIVMNAGEVLLLGHTLADVEFNIDARNGEITVGKITVVDGSGRDVTYLYSLNTYDPDNTHNILHVYDSSCDSECNVVRCEKTRAATHSGGTATCTELATCEICGMLYGEYNADRHTSSFGIFVINPDDHMTHLELANCCGGIISTQSHTPKTAATCTELAVCEHCDWSYGELDPANHSSNEVKYSPIEGNANEHLITHLCCGGTENEAHTGGAATCATLAACEKCGAHYGELDGDNHESSSVGTPSAENPAEHKISYSCCGKEWIEAHMGGTATCKDSAICAVCGAHYGEIDAHNHASDKFNYVLREDNTSMHDMFHSCCNLAAGKAYHSGGTATCAVPAVCEHCGTAYGNTSSEIHSSSEFKYIADGEKHKKLHACCGEEVAVEEHNNAPATCMHGTRCELCGYEQGEKAAHVYDNECDYICNVCEEVSRAANFHVDENKDSMCDHCGAEVEAKGLSGGAISGIAVASVAVVGFGGFAIFWFAIKKRSFEALLKLLIG